MRKAKPPTIAWSCRRSIDALQALKRRVDVRALHRFAVRALAACSTWLPQWKARGWKTADQAGQESGSVGDARSARPPGTASNGIGCRGHAGTPGMNARRSSPTPRSMHCIAYIGAA